MGRDQYERPITSQFGQERSSVKLAIYSKTAVVACISCRNQHLMSIVSTNGPNSGLPTGSYPRYPLAADNCESSTI